AFPMQSACLPTISKNIPLPVGSKRGYPSLDHRFPQTERSAEATNAQAEDYWLNDHEDGIDIPADPRAQRLFRGAGSWHVHDAWR
ncbi:hypothetical protein, partial [Mesorhizobium sp.]|uniref:hypothetical protein n=1 Tax=Mesorhizobium sp. TaxID=1871066 RepID=UPI00257A986B